MNPVNDYLNPFGLPVKTASVTFSDEKNRSKLISYLDRVGSYTNFDKDMILRVFVDESNDFCAFEAVKYAMCFVSTKKKLIDMPSEWRCIEPVTMEELRSMIASHQY